LELTEVVQFRRWAVDSLLGSETLGAQPAA